MYLLRCTLIDAKDLLVLASRSCGALTDFLVSESEKNCQLEAGSTWLDRVSKL